MESKTMKRVAAVILLTIFTAISSIAQQNSPLDNIFTVSNGNGERTFYFHWTSTNIDNFTREVSTHPFRKTKKMTMNTRGFAI